MSVEDGNLCVLGSASTCDDREQDDPTARQDRVTLTGQLCTPKDVLARGVPAPGLRAGDRVAFGLAGAYAWNISHHDFLMHPRPGFHFLDDESTDDAGAAGPKPEVD